MKKIFTFICLAVMSAMMITPARAQENTLSDYEKAQLVKSMVPVMFDQVKQITGIDFLAPTRADFDLVKVVNSPLFAVPNMTLRADDGKTTATFKPEKVVVDISGLGIPVIGEMLKQATITFADYAIITIPYNGRDYEISLPGEIILNLDGIIERAVILSFKTEEGNGFLPFNSLTANLKFDATVTALLAMAGMDIKGGDLITFTETEKAAGEYDYNLVLEKALRDLINLLDETSATLPDFKVALDVVDLNKGMIHASLYGIVTGLAQIPMGDADVVIGEESRVINLTSYENGARIGFRKLTESTTIAEDYTITTLVTDSVREARTAIWVWSATNMTTIEQSSLAAAAAPLKAANIGVLDIVRKSVSDLLNDLLVNEYTITNATVYKLPVTVIEEGEDTETTTIEDFFIPTTSIFVKPGITGSPTNPTGLVDITISSLSEDILDDIEDFDELSAAAQDALLDLIEKDEFVFEDDMVVSGVLSPDQPLLTVAFIDPETDKASATVYIETNVMGIILDTDPVALDKVRIAVQKDGIVVEGMEKGTYSVVNVLGGIVNKGRIDSQSSYISTSALPRGIYVLVLDGDTNEAVKFIK